MPPDRANPGQDALDWVDAQIPALREELRALCELPAQLAPGLSLQHPL